jgi:hypothetical protein
MQIDSDFESFWSLYPRKVARKDALKMWTRLTTEQKFAALQSLPIHIRYWQAAGRTKETTPHAASWINGERWTDELEMPDMAAKDEWWKTQAGILKKAQSLGINPKPGEDYMSLKARILAHLKAAA